MFLKKNYYSCISEKHLYRVFKVAIEAVSKENLLPQQKLYTLSKSLNSFLFSIALPTFFSELFSLHLYKPIFHCSQYKF